MKSAYFQYKCRQCGEVYSNTAIGISDNRFKANMILLSTIMGERMPKGIIGLQPQLMEMHSCNEEDIGVSDLIGFAVKAD